ncbi:MAG: hypothetical protein HQL01_04640 [Nitrospirae bacterium]|nr:hypothetical protein [Nitrospirota bacterium]
MKYNITQNYTKRLIVFVALAVIIIICMFSLKIPSFDNVIYTRTIVFFCIGYVFLFIALYLGGRQAGKNETLNGYFRKAAAAIEKHSIIILIAFIIITSAWLGFVLFKNPFVVTYNDQCAPQNVQMFYNIINGNGPETSMYYQQPPFLASNPYYYASIFAIRQYWSSLGLLAMLYSIYPVPPMQVYAVILIVVSLGSIGIYMAVRSLGATKAMSLWAAMGYILIPQVEHLMFIRGHFDIIGLGILPLVFAALFRRSWGWFYLICLFYATISYPQVFFIMFLGIIVGVFFKAWKQGIITVLIGLSVWLLDNAVLRQALCGIYNEPSYFASMIFSSIFSGNFLATLKGGFIFTLKYITFLLMAVSFLPLFGIRREGRWNLEVIGILLFMLPCVGLSFVYDYGFVYQRNDAIIVPVYLSAFAAYVGIMKEAGQSPKMAGKSDFFRPMLIAGIICVSLFGTTHYPWVVNSTSPKYVTKDYYDEDSFKTLITEQDKNKGRRLDLEKIAEYVPNDASLAFYAKGDILAYLANRQHAWIFPNSPPGVEYFVIDTAPYKISLENMSIAIKIYEFYNDTDKYKILYTTVNNYVIIKNLHPSPIPRNDDILGWKILLDTLLIKRCKM